MVTFDEVFWSVGMSEEIIHVATIFVAACGVTSGVLYGVAAMIHAWFKGKATLIRAERGDPELLADGTSLPSILGPLLRSRRDSSSHPEI